MAKKTVSKKTAVKMPVVKTAVAKKAVAKKTTATKTSARKNVGDVLGISRANVKATTPIKPGSGTRRKTRGIELPTAAANTPKPAGVVGGVRGRGR